MRTTLRERTLTWIQRWEPLRADTEFRLGFVRAIPETLYMYEATFTRPTTWDAAKSGFLYCTRQMDKTRDAIDRETWSEAGGAFLRWMRENPKYDAR